MQSSRACQRGGARHLRHAALKLCVGSHRQGDALSETSLMRLLFSYGFLLMLFGNAAVGCDCLPIPQTPCEEARNAVVFRGRLVEAIPIVDAPMRGLPPPP